MARAPTIATAETNIGNDNRCRSRLPRIRGFWTDEVLDRREAEPGKTGCLGKRVDADPLCILADALQETHAAFPAAPNRPGTPCVRSFSVQGRTEVPKFCWEFTCGYFEPRPGISPRAPARCPR